MAKRAVEHLRRMKGGSQAQLMRCEDSFYYVVKFQNNPQGVRILANEMLATKLALALGLAVAEPEVVEVSDCLVEHSPELYVQWGKKRVRCTSGLQFGSRFVCDPLLTPVYDFLPDNHLEVVINRDSFLSMLVFDKWTCNRDSRQILFHRPDSTVFHRTNGWGDVRYVATMVDQGHCFNANKWTFPDTPLQGLYFRHSVYDAVLGVESFTPFLERLENLHEDLLEEAAACVPPEWYKGRTDEFRRLLKELAKRRRMIGQMILDCRNSKPAIFPRWKAPLSDGTLIKAPSREDLLGKLLSDCFLSMQGGRKARWGDQLKQRLAN